MPGRADQMLMRLPIEGIVRKSRRFEQLPKVLCKVGMGVLNFTIYAMAATAVSGMWFEACDGVKYPRCSCLRWL